ncbi:MAG: 1-acyl-sn-glycerol-3-phosphate acyltransferase [Candidatus Azotimanducaceae bacterium]|jgi:1-acyl-sn-glycerol-3-phosphate acyltransferase
MYLRRLFTISTLTLATILAAVLAPLVFTSAFVMSFFPKFKTTPQAMCFIYGFIGYEWIGLGKFAWVWLRYHEIEERMRQDRNVQFWWGRSLFEMGKRLFKLKIEVTGEDALLGNCALVLCRHTSMADTVLPLLFFGQARAEGLRYVLKQELRYLPCLDIGGHRLPNVFVDRSGSDSAKAIKNVTRLMQEAPDDQSVLIYPEGTRFTRKKHQQLAVKHPNLKEQLERWPDLLPPRLGGVRGMLDANPGKDLVFLAHAGFEGSADINDLLSGGWLNQHVRIHFWRVPFAELPTQEHTDFLFNQWDIMQATAKKLEQEIAAGNPK